MHGREQTEDVLTVVSRRSTPALNTTIRSQSGAFQGRLERDDRRKVRDSVRRVVSSRRVRHCITDPTHVGYLTGYRSILFDLMRDYRSAAIVTRDKGILVTGASDVAAALEVLRDPACVYQGQACLRWDTSGESGECRRFRELPKDGKHLPRRSRAIAAT